MIERQRFMPFGIFVFVALAALALVVCTEFMK
jgi:hypothetical protein